MPPDVWNFGSDRGSVDAIRHVDTDRIAQAVVFLPSKKWERIWLAEKQLISGFFGKNSPSHKKFSVRWLQGLWTAHLAGSFAIGSKRCIYLSTTSDKDSVVLDYFGGSGTTAHATIELNKEDNGERKYLLVEMGAHFYF